MSHLTVPGKEIIVFVFCNNILDLVTEMGFKKFNPNDWHLFIDLSNCVLSHTGNKFGSMPIAYSTKVKEEYSTISLVLDKVKYTEHNWLICVALKMVNFLLGQQNGHMKYFVLC